MEAVHLHRAGGRRLGGVFAVVVGLGLVSGAWRSLTPLLATWGQQEYSHAWFILPLALLIFLQRFRSVGVGGSTAPGLLLAIISIVIMFFAWATGSYTAAIYAAILGAIGYVWASLGSKAIKSLGAPLFYLFFMVPLPLALYISASADMQLRSSQFGLVLISLFRVPATLDGNIIILSSAKLEVAEACSGLRYLFPLVSFAFLISMLLQGPFWKKAVVVFSSVPIAIVLNAVRIAMIAILLERFGIDTAAGPAHAFEGFAVFSVCIAVLFLEVWCLLGIGSHEVGSHGGRFVPLDMLMPDRTTIRRLMAWPVSGRSLLAGLMLLAGTGIVASLPARTEFIPQRRPLALFPMEFEGWHGMPQALDIESLNALQLTDYLLADFADENRADGSFNLYIAYYASQRAGIHAHSPQLCIPGGGWSIVRQAIVALPLTTGGAISVNRVVIEKQGIRQIVYYWFEERGRHIADESVLKYYALRDALVDNRTDGALIRIVAPIQDEGAADAMVRKIAAAIGPLLPSFVPGKIATAF